MAGHGFIVHIDVGMAQGVACQITITFTNQYNRVIPATRMNQNLMPYSRSRGTIGSLMAGHESRSRPYSFAFGISAFFIAGAFFSVVPYSGVTPTFLKKKAHLSACS